VIVTWPFDVLAEEKYSRWSRPVNCCSMTCVTDDFGVGAGVGRADRDGGRGDRRVLRDRQRHDGQRADQHDHDRDNPRENGTLNEKDRHASVQGSCGVLP
jgi:hypothetical protein